MRSRNTRSCSSDHKEALKAIVAQRDYFKTLSLPRMEDIHSVLIKDLGVTRNLRNVRVGCVGLVVAESGLRRWA